MYARKNLTKGSDYLVVIVKMIEGEGLGITVRSSFLDGSRVPIGEGTLNDSDDIVHAEACGQWQCLLLLA